ncbi:MAG: hypothetical protein SFY96_00075 [Planctomycetota bacterium]|nr:hypothetical protein [Planctomycetota bacterium]
MIRVQSLSHPRQPPCASLGLVTPVHRGGQQLIGKSLGGERGRVVWIPKFPEKSRSDARGPCLINTSVWRFGSGFTANRTGHKRHVHGPDAQRSSLKRMPATRWKELDRAGPRFDFSSLVCAAPAAGEVEVDRAEFMRMHTLAERSRILLARHAKRTCIQLTQQAPIRAGARNAAFLRKLLWLDAWGFDATDHP